MKLISNTSFGEFCKSKEKEFSRRIDYLDWFERVRTNFDKFIKQPLKLEMFVPCDEDGDILHEPEDYEQRLPNMMTEYNDEIYRYKQEKEKVLFEGFEFKEYERMICFEKKGIEIFIYNKNYQTFSAPRGRIITIEDLIIYEFELTESAVKQIGL